MSFFKKLFSKQPEVQHEPKIDYTLGELKQGFILDYNDQNWEVEETVTYFWEQGTKELEHTIFNGKDRLYLNFSPSEQRSSVFWEASFSDVWPEAKQKMRQKHFSPSDSFSFNGNNYEFSGNGQATVETSTESYRVENWLFENEKEGLLVSFNLYEDDSISVFTGKLLNHYEVSNILPR